MVQVLASRNCSRQNLSRTAKTEPKSAGESNADVKEAQPAIDAYKSALRAQSDLPNAKRNLELALRLLEEQQRQQEQQQKDSQDQQNQQQKPGGGQGQDQKPDQDQQPKPDPRQPPDPQQEAPQSGGAAEGQPQAGQPPPNERPLPQFEDQKDMTAEQAAAILQAVENLERQQRREQARALARAKTTVEKDW